VSSRGERHAQLAGGRERDDLAALAEHFKTSPEDFGQAESIHDLDNYAQERLGRRISEAAKRACSGSCLGAITGRRSAPTGARPSFSHQYDGGCPAYVTRLRGALLRAAFFDARSALMLSCARRVMSGLSAAPSSHRLQ
jgi:hypothetical protein